MKYLILTFTLLFSINSFAEYKITFSNKSISVPESKKPIYNTSVENLDYIQMNDSNNWKVYVKYKIELDSENQKMSALATILTTGLAGRTPPAGNVASTFQKKSDDLTKTDYVISTKSESIPNYYKTYYLSNEFSTV
jgi:hypothetical protein